MENGLKGAKRKKPMWEALFWSRQREIIGWSRVVVENERSGKLLRAF